VHFDPHCCHYAAVTTNNNNNQLIQFFTLFPALSLESTNLAVKGEEEKQIRPH